MTRARLAEPIETPSQLLIPTAPKYRQAYSSLCAPSCPYPQGEPYSYEYSVLLLFAMDSAKNVFKGGWHPQKKQSWRGEFKGINQIVRPAIFFC